MSRPLRLEFAGALYHVTSRGDRREDIYEDDEDRRSFLSVFADVCELHNWVCHAYCLMSNHYHLLVETPDANLSSGMRQLNGVYTQRYNRRHHKVGHLFQGRYKAILVDKNSYLLELARYIVLNPVRARMVSEPVEWPWSSYLATVGECYSPDWLSVDWLLGSFGKQRALAVTKYKEFVVQGIGGSSPWVELRSQVFLGDDSFVEKMKLNLEQHEDLSEIPSSQRRPLPKSLRDYEKRNTSRDRAIVEAYNSGGYTLSDIGKHFGLHYSRVSRIVGRAKGKT